MEQQYQQNQQNIPYQQQIEQPLYVLSQIKRRIIIPKVITFLFLGIVFYLGVALNIYLLNLSANAETTVSLISLIILTLIVGFGIFINVKKAKQKYFFHHTNITFGKKQVMLQQITDVKTKINFLDKIFKTYSIVLNQEFKINGISQEVQLEPYVKNLVSYAHQRSF